MNLSPVGVFRPLIFKYRGHGIFIKYLLSMKAISRCFLVLSLLVSVLYICTAFPGQRSLSEGQKSQEISPYESWDGKFYDNVIHDTRRFLDEEKHRAEAEANGPSKGLIVGIILGSVALSIVIFCCIAFCVCDCMRDMVCWVKNLLCCCCDED